MAVTFNFTIIFNLGLFTFKLFLQMYQTFFFSGNSCRSFVNGIIFFFLKLTIFIACSFKYSHDFFIQSSILYILHLFSISPNAHIVEIKYPQGPCSPTFVVNGFLKLFYHVLTLFFLVMQIFFTVMKFHSSLFGIMKRTICFSRFCVGFFLRCRKGLYSVL